MVHDPLEIKNDFPNLIFVDDLLREAFWPAKEFFYDLLREPIRQALGINVPPSLRQKFMAANGMPSWDHTTNNIMDHNYLWIDNYKNLSVELEKYFVENIPERSVIIGYELSPGLIKFFEKNNHHWIDFRISPIRFLSDLLIALRTSIPGLQKRLPSLAVRYSEIRLEANKLKASYIHKERYKKEYDLFRSSKDIVYVVGQTEADASLVNGKSLITLSCYEKRLKEIFFGKKVAYLPHPSAAKWHIEKEKSYLTSLNCSFFTDNIHLYNAFFEEKPGTFVGISSGSLQEAPFFNCSSVILYKAICPLYYPDIQDNRSDTSDYDQYWQIPFETFLDPEFIKFIFEQSSKIQRIPLRDIKSNELRQLHDTWWGYADIFSHSNGLIKAQQKELVKKLETIDKKQSVITSMILSFPDILDIKYKNLFVRTYKWIDGSKLTINNDGNFYRNGVISGSWMSEPAKKEYSIILIWSENSWIDKIISNDEWNILIVCNSEGNIFRCDAII
ncbi:hypothetical protein GOB93_00275 [Acetobacter musti]|uniref:Capsule polysaccharide biosynthesis protein n=1 Tax=Acetobacter musti TaxID=864732 RepID=A0ABX0JIN8_9PROT|nr:hypothetical protein [Acetobacter musti]NHN83085.1 hypothetical protein [Acetobacter musti]